MTQARETNFNSSSPHSSPGGADSYKHDGTPDTRITAFSPEDASARSNSKLVSLSLSSASTESQPVRFPITAAHAYKGTAITGEKDPFITVGTSGTNSGPKLSPTASTFRPIAVSFAIPGITHGASFSVRSPSAIQNVDVKLQDSQTSSANLSAELGISRYIMVTSVAENTDGTEVHAFLKKLEGLGSACQGKCQLYAGGKKVFIQLTNIRDAYMIHGSTMLGNPEWRFDFVSHGEFHRMVGQAPRHDMAYEGQVYVVALPPRGVELGPLQIETVLNQVFSTEGEIFAIQRQPDSSDTAFRAVVEFSDVIVANAVATKYNGASASGIQLFTCLFKSSGALSYLGSVDSALPSAPTMPDVSKLLQNMQISGPVQAPNAIIPSSRSAPAHVGLQLQSQMPMYPMLYNTQLPGAHYVVEPLQPRMQTTASITTGLPQLIAPLYAGNPSGPVVSLPSDYASPRAMQLYNRPDHRRQNAMRVSRSSYFQQATHHNHVDVSRIREGIDVRTTIMLRNIPNKVDQAMLKRIIDESSWGKYDFMYLRIDFANDCNVGYAFINFVDPLDIIDFVNARGNQRWNCFKSDKVAEISYATIQGKDCLVQKFRNSSVMLEAPHYRPKLYFTLNGPRPELAGEEEPFPEPDNQSKMKRSCENAEHVGLFTPNAGQHFRDEQRRRRSQYDRGTRLAALEEFDYDSHIPQQTLFATS